MELILINIMLSLTAGNWISIAAIAVVIILAFLGMLGRMLYKQGCLDNGFLVIDKKIDKLDEKFDKLILLPFANTKSPISLTDKGKEIFNRPKIKEFVKNNMTDIVSKMKEINYDSAYKAQERLFNIVDSYKETNYKINLENEAFETGQHIDTLMKIIAIGIRDDIFSNLNLKVEDIDNSKPTKS